MNKQELVEAVSSQLGEDVSRRQVETTLNTILETVATSLRRRESVQLTGFGTFEARSRSARKGLNPRTGESVRIRATTVPAFKPGKSLKDVVAKRTAAKKTAAKKAAAKKSSKKATAKATAKKAAANKSTAKKTAKKATAKATAKKSAARKSAGTSTRKAAKKSARKTARKG